MAKDVGDALRDALGSAVREAAKSAGDIKPKAKRNGRGPFSGARGVMAGAGLAAAAPLAKKGVDAVRSGGLATASPGRAASKVASKAGDKVASNVKDVVSDKVDKAGGAGGIAKEAASSLLPGGGGKSGGKQDMPGVGKGRRMPIQQAVDVACELESVYNQFTQFETWPQFMHRVTNVSQEDETSVHFTTKIWGKTKEYTAEIVTQRPDDRVKWKVAQGITHSGVASFHELAPRLTRIEVTLDVDPGSLIEKAARGMRHVKRAVRADLHRFKAFMEMQEMETGAWRGVIEDGEVVEPHDDDYDEHRDYSDVDDLYDQFGSRGDDEEKDSKDEQDEDFEPIPVEELPRDKSGRFTKGAGARSPNGHGKSGGSSRRSSPSKSQSKSGERSSSSRTAAKRSTSSRSRGSGTGSRSRGATNGSSAKKRSTSGSSRRRGSSRS